jgi:uncharacterized protein
MPQVSLSAQQVEKLLAILVCPACHGKLELSAEGERLRCGDCGRSYPIEDGIPVMLEDRASGGPAAPATKKDNS